MADENGRGRFPQLDVLRGVAILLVLMAHQPIPKARQLGRFGLTGVDLFFVLSGYLIGGMLLAERHSQGRLRVSRFYFRRLLRIWPPYYACLAVTLVVASAFGVPARLALPYLTHVQNYWETLPGLAQHFWSLAVEEHFYLLLPLALALPWPALARHPASIACTSAGLMTLCALGRWASGASYPSPQTHLRIDELCWGVVLAYVTRTFPATIALPQAGRRALCAAGAAVVAVGVLSSVTPERDACLPTLLAVGYGAILISAVSSSMWASNGPMRSLAAIGRVSYSIYLWHVLLAYYPTQILAGQLVGNAPDWTEWSFLMVAYVSLAIGAGALMSRIIEQPVLALRDRSFSLRPPAVFPDQIGIAERQ